MFAYEAVVFGHEAVFQECVDGDAGGRIWGHGVRGRGVWGRSGRMRGACAARKEQLHWMPIPSLIRRPIKIVICKEKPQVS